MKSLYTLLSIAILAFIVAGCSEEKTHDGKENTTKSDFSDPLLEKLDPKTSGVTFVNELKQTPTFNIITYDGLLQGAGVALLDVNNDGLLDIFFAGNMDADRLYLNKGDLKFEDITESAGIPDDKTWSTGLAVVDINEDGYDDIYVCKFLFDDPKMRHNQFLINQKNNTFKDKAVELGVNDPGYGIMANFFDYDNDGDLDLYVLNQPPNALELKKQLRGQRHAAFTDRLYRNDGRKFTNVTGAAGITNYNYALSSMAFDYDRDGDVDLYLACDYEEPDIFYRNNGDGTFTDIVHTSMRHISNFAMGSDMTDLNHDGYLDLYTVDMVAEDNYRIKTNMSGMNPEKFWSLANNGYHYQYMHNTLQLNNGDHSFSEIANMARVSNTDWSWAPLFVDFDRDGFDDLFVTNGIIKEVRNSDFSNWKKDFVKEKVEITPDDLIMIVEKAPSVKVMNNLFRNNGDLTFSHREKEWGIDGGTWSQGACYGDLDNDGDLDLVVNNMNMPADIYINKSADHEVNNGLGIKLKGSRPNSKGFGAKVEVYVNGKCLYQEMTPYRGYMSTNESTVHFGLGAATAADSVFVTWLDGKTTSLGKTKANQVIEIKYTDRKMGRKLPQRKTMNTLAEVSHNVRYKENDYDDYLTEILIPHQMSTLGPIVAVGDVNGDGNDDYYLGGSSGECGQLMVYATGTYKEQKGPWCADKKYEDGGAVFFDAEGDGDMDLIVTSGSNEYEQGSPLYQDRLYINNGQGSFSRAKSFPKISESTSVALPFDYDGDGDLDLFIGGRQVAGHYGQYADSYLLKNNGKLQFEDVTSAEAPKFVKAGMVSDAEWVKVGERSYLIMVGDWMPIRVFDYDGATFVEKTEEFGHTKTSGWWNSITKLDYDGDGDEDLIVGNLGTNMKFNASEEKPFKVYVDDFDDNGTNDVYLGQVFQDGNYYPIRGRQCSSEQMPFIKKEYENYDAFARTTIEDILKERMDSTTTFNQVHTFASIIMENTGSGFERKALPNAAQISPIFDALAMDINGDGDKEILLVGNYYNREVETTRSDASNGLVFHPENMKVEQMSKYGGNGSGDVRAMKKMSTKDGDFVLIAVNNQNTRLFKINKQII